MRPREHLESRWKKAFLILASLALSSGFLFYGFIQSYSFQHHTPYPTDGPFQLFNALRRLSQGQFPPYFHGQGIPLLHYPLFVLLGRTVQASEMSRYTMTFLFLAASTWSVACVFLRGWASRLQFVLVSVVAYQFFRLTDFLDPGNAQYMARTFFPWMGFCLAWTGLRPLWKTLAVGILGGLSLFCGTEQGLAFLAAWSLVGFLLAAALWLGKKGAGPVGLGLNLGFLWTLALLVLFALWALEGGMKAVRECVLFYFSELPHDQFWYFGVPPNRFIASWKDFFMEFRVAAATLAGLAVFLWLMWRMAIRSTSLWDPSMVAAALVAYGLISCVSCLGYYDWHYVETLARVEITFFLLLWFQWVSRGKKSHFKLKANLPDWMPLFEKMEEMAAVCLDLADFRKWPRFRAAASAFMVLFLSGWVALDFWQREDPGMVSDFIQDWSQGRLPDRGAPWGLYLDQSLSVIRGQQPPGQKPVFWSTYAGWLHSELGIFNPVQEDYIIHALGPVRRRQYLEDFKALKPEWVETMRRSQMRYEDWLQCTSWGFYQEVLDHYRVAAVTPHSLLWRRREKPGPPVQNPSRFFTLSAGQSSFQPPDDFEGVPGDVVVVRVEYRVRNFWKYFPLLKSIPRYLVFQTGALCRQPASLPPDEIQWEFPVFPVQGQKWFLHWGAFSFAKGASLEVQGISLTKERLEPDQQAFLEPPPQEE